MTPECPQCKSQKIVAGHFAAPNHSGKAIVSFVPNELKWYQFSMEGGAQLKTEAFACLDCAMVWSSAMYPDALRRVVGQIVKEK